MKGKIKHIKHLFVILTFVLVAVCTMAVTSFAASGSGGIYDLVTTGTGVAIAPQTAVGASITVKTESINGVDEEFYEGAEKVIVTASAITGSYYVVLALDDGSTIPTEENITYIDQKTGSSMVTFSVYPNKLENEKTYTIYLVSNDSDYSTLTAVASFKYYLPYMLGDVTGDEKINSGDSVLVLQHSAKIITLTSNQFLAADTSKDEKVNSADSVLILQYSAKIITEF